MSTLNEQMQLKYNCADCNPLGRYLRIQGQHYLTKNKKNSNLNKDKLPYSQPFYHGCTKHMIW